MGMYTECMGIVKINKKYAEAFREVIINSVDWIEVDKHFDLKSFDNFKYLPRANLIPFCGSDYHLSPTITSDKDFDCNISFWFEIKSYHDELDYFYAFLRDVCDEIHCFKTKYEEYDEWTNHLT